MAQSFLAGRVVAVVDDLTRQDVDAIVNAEAAGLLDPVFKEWVAQGVRGLRFVKICAFDNETIFAHGGLLGAIIYHRLKQKKIGPIRHRTYSNHKRSSDVYRTLAYCRFNVSRKRSK